MLKKALIPFLIIVSFLFLILLRFVYINNFPSGLTNDDLDVILSAKSYFQSGTDLSGVSFPKSMFANLTNAGLSGLPSYLLTYIYGPYKLSPFLIRIPFILLSIIVSYLIYLIVFEIVKDKKVALISLFISLINPWLYFYSRQPTEAPFALLFALIGVYLLLKTSGYRVFWSIPFFVASFYSYFGAKPVVPIFVILFIVWVNKSVRPLSRIVVATFIVSMFALVFSYFAMSKYYGGGTLSQRENQLTFLNFDKYSSVVNDSRRVSIDFPLKNLFYNKYTVFVKTSIAKFLGPFSLDYLFLSGDSVVPFEDHGVLYLLDLPVIFLGLYHLFKTKSKNEKNLLWLVILFLIVGSVGPAVSLMGNQFVFRAFLHIPAYIILISYALSKLNKIILTVSLLFYILLFINFLVFFFFRYSISQQDNHFVAERVVASYINRTNEVYVVSSESERLYYQAVFYNNGASEKMYIDKCPVFEDNRTYIVDTKLDCNIEDDYVVIQNQKDSGVKYKIVNDNLCKNVMLSNYRRDHKISDYNIEALDDIIFCNRWIQNGKTN